MRVTSVDLYSNDSEFISFKLRDAAPNDPYLIKAMIGLDADEIVHTFYGFGASSMERFYNFSLTKREIVMRIVMNPRYILNETPSNIRDELYRMISSNRSGAIDVIFNSGGASIAKATAYITKFEVPHFSNVAEVQITLMCEDPLFHGVNPVVLPQYPDLTDIGGGPLGANVASNPLEVVDARSTAPHGFVLNVGFGESHDTFTLQEKQNNPDWTFKVDPGTIASQDGFVDGDTLHISSVAADKYVKLVRGGTTYDILDKVELDSVWPVLFPGQNEFFCPELFASTDKFIYWTSLEYYPAYWGV